MELLELAVGRCTPFTAVVTDSFYGEDEGFKERLSVGKQCIGLVAFAHRWEWVLAIRDNVPTYHPPRVDVEDEGKIQKPSRVETEVMPAAQTLYGAEPAKLRPRRSEEQGRCARPGE